MVRSMRSRTTSTSRSMPRFRPNLSNLFAATPLAILQPRTAIAWQFAPNSVLRTGFGLFSDILPASVADAIGMNPPYVQTFQGGLLGTVGGTAIAPGVPNSAVDAAVAANQAFDAGFAQGELSCASPQANPSACLQPVAITAVPDGTLHPHTSWSGASGSSISSEAPPVFARSTSELAL